MGSELGLPLKALLDSETWPHGGLKFIVEIPPGSKVRYLDLVVFPLQVTLVVTPSGSFSMFPSPLYGTCHISLLRSMLDISLCVV